MRLHCPYCFPERQVTSDSQSGAYVRIGTYFRACDRRSIQRYRCLTCARTFSNATFTFTYRQRKRRLNAPLRKLLCSGLSQRRAALVFAVNRKTVVRRLKSFAENGRANLEKWNDRFSPAIEMEFDDLESFEHSKLKPLSITLAVEKKTRRILGVEVARMPAKGQLAKAALAKYGRREDQRKEKRRALFARIQHRVHENGIITSDSNPYYFPDVKSYFPACKHKTVISRRAAVVGQGELKKIGFDPIFSINHSCAKSRADLNRLFRKTWCTTKRADRLADHLAIYIDFHNRNFAGPDVGTRTRRRLV